MHEHGAFVHITHQRNFQALISSLLTVAMLLPLFPVEPAYAQEVAPAADTAAVAANQSTTPPPAANTAAADRSTTPPPVIAAPATTPPPAPTTPTTDIAPAAPSTDKAAPAASKHTAAPTTDTAQTSVATGDENPDPYTQARAPVLDRTLTETDPNSGSLQFTYPLAVPPGGCGSFSTTFQTLVFQPLCQVR
jgi:hypothetical protein